MLTAPDCRGISVERTRNNVVLPPPLGPSTANISPPPICSETSSSARREPYEWDTPATQTAGSRCGSVLGGFVSGGVFGMVVVISQLLRRFARRGYGFGLCGIEPALFGVSGGAAADVGHEHEEQEDAHHAGRN